MKEFRKKYTPENIPTFEECKDVPGLTPLHIFIYANEPADEDDVFRQQLCDMLNYIL
jgi:hypothetical protein